jgi:O-antigen/teichoic acid export membrane protein
VIEARRFGSQVGIVGSGRTLYVGSVFILNIGLARLMGPEGFGAFGQVFMFSAFFLIMTLGVPETLYYFMPRLTGADRARMLGGTVLLLGVIGIAVAVVFYLFAPHFARMQHNPGIAPDIRMFGLYGACIVAASFADPVFIVLDRVRYLFALSAAHGGFFLFLTGWYWLERPAAVSLFGAMAVFGAAKLVFALILLVRTLPDVGIALPRSMSVILIQMSMALPLALSSTIDIMSRWLDKFVVSFFFGTESFGLFYAGAIEIPFVTVLVASIYNVMSPRLNALHHEGNIDGFTATVRNTIAVTAAFIWPFWLYMMLFADRLIVLVFGAEFLPAAIPFRVYLVMMPLRIVAFGALMIAVERPRGVFIGAAVALAVNAFLNVVLAKMMGFVGPAVATVIATYLHVVIMTVFLVRALGIKVRDLVPWRMFGLITFSMLLAGIAAAMIGSRIPEVGPGVVWSGLAFCMIYLFVGRRIGIIRRSRSMPDGRE